MIIGKCGNCHRQCGALELTHRWGTHIVCFQCYEILLRQASAVQRATFPESEPIPYATPVVDHVCSSCMEPLSESDAAGGLCDNCALASAVQQTTRRRRRHRRKTPSLLWAFIGLAAAGLTFWWTYPTIKSLLQRSDVAQPVAQTDVRATEEIVEFSELVSEGNRFFASGDYAHAKEKYATARQFVIAHPQPSLDARVQQLDESIERMSQRKKTMQGGGIFSESSIFDDGQALPPDGEGDPDPPKSAEEAKTATVGFAPPLPVEPPAATSVGPAVSMPATGGISQKAPVPAVSPPDALEQAWEIDRSGDAARALSAFRKVLALRPSSADARLGAGHCLCKLGNYKEAAPYLEAALSGGQRLGRMFAFDLAATYLRLEIPMRCGREKFSGSFFRRITQTRRRRTRSARR